IVAGEEVVYNSLKPEAHTSNSVTKDYTLIGNDVSQPDNNNVLYGRMNLKVSVMRKVDTETSTSSQWFPKKVVIMTDKRRIESMAWAHSSNDLMACSSSSEISCPIDSDSRTDLSIDSDPSLSSINAQSWYSSQNPPLPSTSSASSTSSFQLNSMEIEPDIDSGSLRTSSPPIDTGTSDDTQKGISNDEKYGIEVRQFNIPVKIYPRNTRHKSQSRRNSESNGYPCLIEGCTSILKTRTALRKHAKVHAVRNFSCERCGRTFIERTKLNRHMLTHTGERAFRCQFDGCSKAFSLEANLKSHIKTHTGEKPHKCQICQHAFSHPYNLRVHIARRHKEQSST
ncbi:putative transcription factor yin yang 2, partial [Trichostrongylus colubriformis]